MDLIERYLAAVRWNLPAAKAEDIVAELEDVLANRIEEREDSLGRALTESERAALLRSFGHPLVVAGRYQGQRSLIGPEVFPFWWFCLKIVAGIVVLVELVELAGRAIVGSAPLAQVVVQTWWDATASLILCGGLVTLAFALVERSRWLQRYLEQWDPAKLPALRLKGPARRPWEAVFEILVGAGFLLWWCGAVDGPTVPSETRVAVTLTPVWDSLFWPVVALVSARILLMLVALLRPRWHTLRALLSIATATGMIGIAATLYAADRVVAVSGTGDSSNLDRIQEGLDTAFALAVPAIALVAVWQCATELWQLARERRA